MNASDLLADSSRKFQHVPEPASAASIAALQGAAPLVLPVSYLQLLRATNGAEGELAVEPGWFQFWPADEVVPLNRAYEVENFFPGFFGFGSSGGGVMFAFSIAAGSDSPVFGIPFISEPEDISVVTSTFDEFLLAMGRACD